MKTINEGGSVTTQEISRWENNDRAKADWGEEDRSITDWGSF